MHHFPPFPAHQIYHLPFPPLLLSPFHWHWHILYKASPQHIPNPVSTFILFTVLASLAHLPPREQAQALRHLKRPTTPEITTDLFAAPVHLGEETHPVIANPHWWGIQIAEPVTANVHPSKHLTTSQSCSNSHKSEITQVRQPPQVMRGLGIAAKANLHKHKVVLAEPDFVPCHATYGIQMENNVRSFSLTTDWWTSHAVESYLSLTAHYMTANFEIKSTKVDCFHMKSSHTAANIEKELSELFHS
ncbi:hypothetical protein PR048_008130 [Dryococelus australis]|uniref:Uncharacterized protein n=1 Tax=Dryococelus australis TaxID=614101 RepID=A0ABQ9HXV7_9NEOP|nr:hypothetical protein PR048_008130 [Dryococelus australis]